MPVSRIGQAAREHPGEPERERARDDGDDELDPRAERAARGARGTRAGRSGRRRACSGSGIAAPRRKPPSVARFQISEEAQLGAEQERERPLPRAGDDAERLVGEEERRDRALAAGQRGSRGRATLRRGACRTLRRSVVSTISSPAAPAAKSPTALNWALPAKTKRRERLRLDAATARRRGP